MSRAHRSVRVFVGAIALATLASRAAAADPVTTKSLLSEMSNLARLAELRSPSYVSKQSSSHDPRSTSPSDPTTWFANEDMDHFQGTAQHAGRTEYVMLHTDGPGAVVRIWSANPIGTLRIYIDGNETPAIEAPMTDLLGGKVKGLPRPIAGEYSKGFSLYLPMPYAKSCEVTSDKKGFYYSVDYRTYPAGTAVTSFTHADVEHLSNDIDWQAKRLAEPRDAGVAPEKTDRVEMNVAPGANAQLSLDGARAITHIRLQMPQGISEAALRAATLRMTFDGERTVDVPLGDFFGSGPGINPFETLPLGMSKSGELYANWFMPFRESAVIEVKNLGSTPIAFTGEVGTVAHTWDDSSLHFHASYHAEHDRATRPMFDWNYLTANGAGAFVGASFTIDNPSKAWWGEGDEKFYVDGETQPSWFGTGTEDYYGYAWGSPDLIQQAYHSQSRCDGPEVYGRTSVNRFHIVDDVPFTKSFKFDMEIWHWKSCNVNIAATTYWYGRPGASDGRPELTPVDVAVYPMPAYKPVAVAGAIEGESMRVIHRVADVGTQVWDGLSGDSQLWWRDAKPGDTIVVGFNAPAAGQYHVVGRFLTASDYGIVRLAINDKVVKDSIDFYNDTVQPTDEIDLGTVDLAAGENKLAVTALGTNPKGKQQHLFGLDYLRIDPVGASTAKQ